MMERWTGHVVRMVDFRNSYLLTHSLTPWCRILFEKLIVTQLIKKPCFLYGTRHHRAHKSPPVDPILSQLNPVRPIDPHLPKVQLILNKQWRTAGKRWSSSLGLSMGPTTPHRKKVICYEMFESASGLG
jgi:hypothetical protein